MRIYNYSMRFRVPVLDQSDCSICYSYELSAKSKLLLGSTQYRNTGIYSMLNLCIASIRNVHCLVYRVLFGTLNNMPKF